MAEAPQSDEIGVEVPSKVGDVLAGPDGPILQSKELKAGEPISNIRRNAQVRATIAKIFRDNNYDPFVEMVRAAKDKDTPLKIRAFLACELAQYVAPKLKSIDIDASVTGDFRVLIKTFGNAVQQGAIEASVEPDGARLIELNPLNKAVG